MNKPNTIPVPAQMPKFDKFIQPTFTAIKANSDIATNEEIYKLVLEIMNLPKKLVEFPHLNSSTQSEVRYRLAWARTYLSKYGAIINCGRSEWEISPQFKNVDHLDVESLLRAVGKTDRHQATPKIVPYKQAKVCVGKSPRNPAWTEEELVLALDLYLKHDVHWLNSASENTNEIVELSNKLKEFHIFRDDQVNPSNFRNPSGVHMKLMNFMGADPSFEKSGLRNGSKLDQVVWNKYFDNRTLLESDVERIKKSLCTASATAENGLLNTTLEICSKAISYLEKTKSEFLGKNESFTFETNSCIANLTSWIVKAQPISQMNLSKKKAEEKVGAYVHRKFRWFEQEKLLDKDNLKRLQNPEWCKLVFHVGHPLLIEVNPAKQAKDQTCVDGYMRYWAKTFSFDGKKYYACKEWFENNRKHFDAWMESQNLI